MSPELYNDTTAEDETYFCMQLSENEKRARLKAHRDHYITSRDFAYLAEKGINTVPGSQNGSDNAGLCGIVQWSNHPDRVEKVLDVLERLALRYGQEPALFGIEVLNEPMPSDDFLANLMNTRPEPNTRYHVPIPSDRCRN